MSQAPLLPSEHFSPSVSLHSGRPATTSLEVAKFFGKRHDHVVRSIQDLISNTPKLFSAPNFGAAEYSDEQGKPRPMLILYRDGFMLLVMGYTGKKALAMKLAYIEAFNRMEEELARQKEAARNITQDIVDFPGSLSITPSSVADRKPLRALVGSWAQVSGLPFSACWNQLKAAFNLANIKELPQEWIPDALAWVQARIDALPKALPPQPERLPLYRNGCFYPPHRDRTHVPGPQEAGAVAGLDTARSRPPARVHGHAPGAGRPPRRPVQLRRVRSGTQCGYHVQPAVPAGQPVPEPHGSRAALPAGTG